MYSVKPRLREMPSNRYEANFEVALSFVNWKFLHCGWPDYLVIREGGVVFIEVKGVGDHLQHNQVIMFDVLTAMGLPLLICRDGDPANLVTVDQYIKSQGLIRVIESNALYLRPELRGVKDFSKGKGDVYFDHSWVYKYLGVKDARSTDHAK